MKLYYCWLDEDKKLVVSEDKPEGVPMCLSVKYKPGTYLAFWAQSESDAKSMLLMYLTDHKEAK